MKKVSILGCGWVGKALAGILEEQYTVQCLSRDMEANDKAKMYDCDVFVIAIPPRDNYLEVLEENVKQVNVKTQVILLSSISFYDGKTLVIQAESLVHSFHADVCILRLGGLMGYDRIAGKYTAGKVLTSDTRTNYIHRDDVLEIIQCVIAKNLRTEAFKVVAPLQSTKKVIFDQNAKQFGFEKTDFLTGDEEGKVLSPKKLCERLDYTFLKEDVHEFWQPSLS